MVLVWKDGRMDRNAGGGIGVEDYVVVDFKWLRVRGRR